MITRIDSRIYGYTRVYGERFPLTLDILYIAPTTAR